MRRFAGKRILLGVTASIAAYKAIQIVRNLTEAGSNVQVVLTPAATHFAPALPLQIFSKQPVLSQFFSPVSDILHVTQGREADLILIAPATADFMAKMAMGLAEDLLSAILLSASAPVLLAPAMDFGMWEHPAVQRNVSLLKERGCVIVGPEWGPLASGLSGMGRMADEKTILDCAATLLFEKENVEPKGARKGRLASEVVLVTAGPTQETIDPVRFLSNRSSGKMGYAIAQMAKEWGAEVILISGPTALPEPPGIQTIFVRSAAEMQEKVEQQLSAATIVIMAAAVSDYTPSHPSRRKEKLRSISLRPTADILKGISKNKGERIFVGFAAETEALYDKAWAKLQEKGLDLIVANDVTQEGAGFDTDTNIVEIIDASGYQRSIPKMSKREVAVHILEEVVRIRDASKPPPRPGGVPCKEPPQSPAIRQPMKQV